MGPDTTLENFKQCRYEEEGDFVDQLYEKKSAIQNEKDFSLTLERIGLVTQQGNAHHMALGQAVGDVGQTAGNVHIWKFSFNGPDRI